MAPQSRTTRRGSARALGTLWLDALNGFAWLRDLRDCGDPAAAAARRPPGRRLDRIANGAGRRVTWRRDVLAARIVSLDPPLRLAGRPRPIRASPARFVFSLARQRAHLRARRRAPAWSATRRCAALKALIFADLAFLRDGKRYEKSLEQTLVAARPHS